MAESLLGRLCGSAIVVMASVAAVPGAVAGQAGPGTDEELGGLMLGLSLGVGSMACTGCVTELAMGNELRVGYRFTERLAIGLTVAGIEGFAFEDYTSEVVNTASITYWPTSQIWIRGGVGVGRTTHWGAIGEIIGQNDWGPGFMAAVGYEVLRIGRFVIDGGLRYAWASPGTEQLSNLSGLLGANFFW